MTPENKAFEAHLKELVEVISTSTSPGWMRIMKRLEEMADEGREQMVGAGDKPDIVLAPLARRWIQREAMVRDINQYIDSCKTEQDELIKSLEKERSSDGEPD